MNANMNIVIDIDIDIVVEMLEPLLFLFLNGIHVDVDLPQKFLV